MAAFQQIAAFANDTEEIRQALQHSDDAGNVCVCLDMRKHV